LYGGSKGAVIGMTLPMARDLARYKIRVNTMAPGPFSTPMGAALPEKAAEALNKSIPLGRQGKPEEFA
jgi:NAD(P)-dependent dehydrogenase (short-subunit alcohol dehydrogenase family)